MNVVAFDTETALIRPALLAPPLVCVSWQRPGQRPGLVHWADAKPRIEGWLKDPTTVLTAHNAEFDSTVICAQFPELVSLVFKAYRENRITCTKKRQQLLDIAGGVYRGGFDHTGKWRPNSYDLDALSRRLLGRPLQKDGWRYSYAEFRDVPLDKWPDRARELQARARVRRAELADTEENEFEITQLDAILSDTPEGVLRYPLDDAETALGVYLAQEKHAEPYLRDQYRQAYAYFVLYLNSTWGFRTDPAGVEALREELDEAHRELEEELQALGMVRANGVRDMKVVKRAMIQACAELGLPLRRTDGHTKPDQETGRTCAETVGEACEEHVCLDSDACDAVVEAAENAGGLDSPFEAYAEFVAVGKMLSNDCKMLASATVYPVHTHYDIAETGRTTSSKPNIQNLNTGRVRCRECVCGHKDVEHKGPCTACSCAGFVVKSVSQRLRKGVRQAFIPRPGHVFMQADYPQLELYTLAQTCMSWLGHSKLAEMLNAGMDPHLAFAAKLLGMSYEDAAANKKRPDVDTARQVGKVNNFGKPGGMGDKKLKNWARKTYGIELSLEQLKEYGKQWKETFPEMVEHFARVNAMFGEDTERVQIETLWTERWRGGATYCAACNNGFQGLGVDCAKAGLCLVGAACYVDTRSPLYGSRVPGFVHDELVGETVDGPGAHDAAFEMARLMVEGANRYLPDVPIPMTKMEPTLMRRWSKDATQVFVNGRLVPWDIAA